MGNQPSTANCRVQCPNQEDRISSPVTYHWGHSKSCLVFCILSFRWCNSPSAGIPQKLVDKIQRVMNGADRLLCEVPRGEYVSDPPPLLSPSPTHPHLHPNTLSCGLAVAASRAQNRIKPLESEIPWSLALLLLTYRTYFNITSHHAVSAPLLITAYLVFRTTQEISRTASTHFNGPSV